MRSNLIRSALGPVQWFLKGNYYRFLTRNCHVPIVEFLGGPDRRIRKGRFEGIGCYYKTALLNTLIKLKPQVSLEIGTHVGGTTRVFQHYFKRHEPYGRLITADIRKYCDVTDARTTQVIVYPHVTNIGDYHDVNETQMLPHNESQINNSVELNCQIIREALYGIGAEGFDFCFVDGDHQRKSFLGDIATCAKLSKRPHYILLDDTKDELHECSFIYQNELRTAYDHYDFDDWMPRLFVGMSLIWEKQSSFSYRP